jgi:hypothetical protein
MYTTEITVDTPTRPPNSHSRMQLAPPLLPTRHRSTYRAYVLPQ